MTNAADFHYFADLPPVVPEPGKSYYLRAGCVAHITQRIEIYGHTFWRGTYNDGDPTRWQQPNVWSASGAYSPAKNVRHELDIIWELS